MDQSLVSRVASPLYPSLSFPRFCSSTTPVPLIQSIRSSSSIIISDGSIKWLGSHCVYYTWCACGTNCQFIMINPCLFCFQNHRHGRQFNIIERGGVYSRWSELVNFIGSWMITFVFIASPFVVSASDNWKGCIRTRGFSPTPASLLCRIWAPRSTA